MYNKTIQKLKDLSNVIFIPAVALYFFGFICVNSYLGRFGIVTFEVINARFLIAGVFPLISLIGVFYIFWKFYTELPPNNFFSTKNFQKKAIAHLEFITSLFTVSYILTIVMQLGNYLSIKTGSYSLNFKPILGNFDFIGDYIANFNLHTGVTEKFVIKTTLYIFSYLFLMCLIALLVVIVTKWIPKKQNNTNHLDSVVSDENEELSGNDVQVENKYNPWYKDLPAWFFNWFMFSVYLSLAVFSYVKLRTEIFDFSSLSHYFIINFSLVFSWVFSTFFIIYLFSFSMNFSGEKLKTEPLKEISKIKDYVLLVFQQGLLPVFASLFLFGITIFPHIPYVIGGGEPRVVRIIMNDSNKTKELLFDDKVYLLGESGQFFFVVSADKYGKNGHAYQISKNSVFYVETKTSEIIKSDLDI